MLLAVFVQTAGIVWWAAGVSSDVRELTRRMGGVENKIEATQKSMTDAQTPAAGLSVRFDLLVAQVNSLRDQMEAARRKK